MNPLITDVAKAVDAERLRQARAAAAGRLLVAGKGAPRVQRRLSGLQFILLAVAVLVLALSGTATAARLITGKQIKDGSVTGADLRPDSIGSADVGDGSLAAQDFAELVTGPPGPRGERGVSGPDGPQGPHGLSRLQYVVTPAVVPKSSHLPWTAECPSGTVALGGGASSNAVASTRVIASAPDDDGRGWVVDLQNTSSQAYTGFAWAVCAASS